MEGICDICGRVSRLYTCILCGRRVCSRCYLPDKGVCMTCPRGRQVK